MNELEMYLKQNEIDKKITNIWGEDCSLDGITDIEKYISNELHTLWILKEMNRDFKKSGTLNQRDYLKNGAGWNMGTWGNVMRVTMGIIEYAASDGNEKLYYKDLPKLEMDKGNKDYRYYYSESRAEQTFPLDEIAMINIHKGVGTSSSDNFFIASHYAKKEIRELILEQIEFINPELIIVCNHVEQLLCDIAEVQDFNSFIDGDCVVSSIFIKRIINL